MRRFLRKCRPTVSCSCISAQRPAILCTRKLRFLSWMAACTAGLRHMHHIGQYTQARTLPIVPVAIVVNNEKGFPQAPATASAEIERIKCLPRKTPNKKQITRGFCTDRKNILNASAAQVSPTTCTAVHLMHRWPIARQGSPSEPPSPSVLPRFDAMPQCASTAPVTVSSAGRALLDATVSRKGHQGTPAACRLD